MGTAINIIGWLASICMICGYLPQAIYTIRTRDTDGIALPTFPVSYTHLTLPTNSRV